MSGTAQRVARHRVPATVVPSNATPTTRDLEQEVQIPRIRSHLGGFSVAVAMERPASDNTVMRLSPLMTTTAILAGLLLACSAGGESEAGAGSTVPDTGAADVAPEDSPSDPAVPSHDVQEDDGSPSWVDVQEEDQPPSCVEHQTTIRLTGRTIGEDIPDGPVLLDVTEEWSRRCGPTSSPGARIGQFETTLGEDFDFEVIAIHESAEPPRLSILALVDVDGNGRCDDGVDAMGSLWIPPDETLGLILELTAGLCIGLI